MTFDGETIWIWMSEYRDGSIGMVGAQVPGMGNMPLMGRDEATVRAFEPVARLHGTRTGQKVWLRKFTKSQDFP